MIYQVDDYKKNVDIKDIDDHHTYIGMMNLEELKACYQDLHISYRSIERCEMKSSLTQNILIPHQKYYYGLINLINARDIFMKKDTFAFFIFENIFLVVVLDDDDHHIADIFHSTSHYVMEKGVSIIRFIYYFLSELIARDYEYIEELQDEIEELENHNTEDESVLFTQKLKSLNKELLLLRNYYDHLVSVSEELEMNHYHIFQDDDMRYFKIFTRRIERLSENVQMLRELLNQAYDFHQSTLEYRLNKTMKLFTVVTTIFMPLTLITGWYGMNFYYMPELKTTYGYYVVIAVSLIVVSVLIIWFKKKKFL